MREINCQCGTKFSIEQNDLMVVRCPRCAREFEIPAGNGNYKAPGCDILPYAPAGSPARVGPFMLGFFGALGYSAAAVILMGSTFEMSMAIHGLLFVLSCPDISRSAS